MWIAFRLKGKSIASKEDTEFSFTPLTVHLRKSNRSSDLIQKGAPTNHYKISISTPKVAFLIAGEPEGVVQEVCP
jgi:hypothetical protein